MAGTTFAQIMGYAWELLSFEVPGLFISCKAWVIVLVLANIAAAALRYAFGFEARESYRSWRSSHKRRISNERKGDQF